MENSEVKYTFGLSYSGFAGMLTLLLVLMKCLGLFHFSWWVVFAPIWAPAAGLLLIVAGIIVLVVAMSLIGWLWLVVEWLFGRSRNARK